MHEGSVSKTWDLCDFKVKSTRGDVKIPPSNHKLLTKCNCRQIGEHTIASS